MKETVKMIDQLLKGLGISSHLWTKDGKVRFYLTFESQNKFAAESKCSYIDLNYKWLVEGVFGGPGAQTRENRERKLNELEKNLEGFQRIDINEAIQKMKIESL